MRVINDVYAVFFDTNAIKGKQWLDYAVKTSAVSMREDIIIEINLYLPEVVQREWSRYYSNYAQESYRSLLRANRLLGQMNLKTLKTHPIYDEETVNKASKRVLKNLGFKFVPTPHDSIDFKEILELAISKQPPFQPEDGTDKGLKDAVIVHTIKHYAAKHPKQKIVFISSDKLITTYAKSSLQHLPDFRTYGSIVDFAEEMKLKNNELSKDLTTNATAKFFTTGSEDSFYKLLKVKDKIQLDYTQLVSKVDSIQEHLSNLDVIEGEDLFDKVSRDDWQKRSDKVLISDSRFNEKKGNILIWSNNIDFIQSYGAGSNSGRISSVGDNFVIKHKVSFRITWSAVLSKDGTLVTPSLIESETLAETKSIAIPTSGSTALASILSAQQSASVLSSSLLSNLDVLQSATTNYSSLIDTLKESITIPDTSWIADLVTPKLELPNFSSHILSSLAQNHTLDLIGPTSPLLQNTNLLSNFYSALDPSTDIKNLNDKKD